MIIAPSILSADFADFGAECRALGAEGADWIHVDIMDGHFVPNLTFGAATCAAIRPHVRGVMDVHLMVTDPDRWIPAVVAGGADRITVHPESGPHVHRTLQTIRAAGRKAGLALNPATGLDCLDWLMDDLDLICVMTVNPGFGGQALIPAMIEKIRAVKARIAGRPILIEADGGVTTGTAGPLARAGADVLVAGSAVFAGGSAASPGAYGENLRALLRAAASG